MAQAELILNFLRQLAQHNDRTWFADHRANYEAAKTAFDEITQAFINRLATFDPSVAHLTPKDCTYRIYRDTRFREDKTPYKQHMGCYVSAHGKKAYHGGYYLHIEPDNCLMAGGAWCPPADMLRAVRQSIVDEIDEYRAIVEDKKFHHLFPVIGMDRIKTVPKGFPKDFPYLEYIRCKDFTCEHSVPDTFFTAPDWLDRVEDMCRTMKPFLDFVNFTIDDYE